MTVTYLSVDALIRINEIVAAEQSGVRNRDDVASAAGRPRASFEGEDLYPSIWAKAGALLHALATTQGFSNGNKRTAWIATDTFLRANGQHLRPVPPIAGEAIVNAVVESLDFREDKAAEWLYEHRLRATDRHDYSLVAETVLVNKSGTYTATKVMGSSMEMEERPHFFAPTILTRVFGLEADGGRQAVITMGLDQSSRARVALVASPEDEALARTAYDNGRLQELDSPEFSAEVMFAKTVPSAYIPSGVRPAAMIWPVPLLVFEPGVVGVELRLDGELMHRIELSFVEYSPEAGQA